MLRLKSVNLFDYDFDGRCEHSQLKKLRDRLKELAHLVSNHRIVKIDYHQKCDALFIAFNNGIVSWVYFTRSNRIANIHHDKYLVNKLLSEHVVNFELRDHYALVSYTLSKLTLVAFNNSPDDQKNRAAKFKFATRNPQVCVVELDNVNTRRVERKLILNESGDLLIVWWRNGSNCVAPWSAPGRGLRDLANVLVYSFTRTNFELITFGCICGEIYEIAFVRWNPNQIIILQQSEEAVNVLNYNIYEISDSFDSLHLICSIRVPLMRACLKAQITAAQDKIVMLCDDDSIILFNIDQNALFALHSSVAAFDFACSQLDALFVVSDQFGRVSLYDYALNTIQINYDELYSEGILHLRQIKFVSHKRFYIQFCGEKPNIAIMTLPGEIDNKTLITEYIRHGKCQEAIASLQSINWNCYGDVAYFSLNTIFNQLIKEPLNPTRESQLESTLATFFTPKIPIDEQIYSEYQLEMHFLAKRLFYHLLCYNCLDKAFLLAIDLKSRQLFELLHRISLERGNQRLAQLALVKSRNIVKQSSHSKCEEERKIEENNNNSQQSKVSIKKVSEEVPATKLDAESTKSSVENVCTNMPVASILKPSSSLSTAAIVPTKQISLHFESNQTATKPVMPSFRHSSEINGNQHYTTPQKIKKIVERKPKVTNGTVDKTKTYKTKVDVHQEDTYLQEEANKLTTDEISKLINNFCYQMSCEQQMDEPPLEAPPPIPSEVEDADAETKPSPLPRSVTINKTGSNLGPVPPELPPKTYLNKQTVSPPQLPPKTFEKTVLTHNNNNNSINNNIDLQSKDSFGDSISDNDSVPANISHFRSGSKIECIHFGVV